jgi:multidrug efflux pump
VAQVRNDLPPEAQAPVIELSTADSQFAAMYIGFSAGGLDQSQITDYLTRVVQPEAQLAGRRAARRDPRRPDVRDAHLAQAGPHGGDGISPSQVRDALARNNYLSTLGATKGSMTSVNLVANTNLQTTEEFKKLVVKQNGADVVRLGDVADVVLGAENYDQDVHFDGKDATFMGIWVLPTANSLEVIKRVREAIPAIRAQLPTGMAVGIPYDSTEYIQNAITR